MSAAGHGGDVGGAPRAGEREVPAELVEDNGPPKRVMGGDDIERLGGRGERGEVSDGQKAEDVEEEVIRERAKRTETRVPEVGAPGGSEEEVPERLDEAASYATAAASTRRGGRRGRALQVEGGGIVGSEVRRFADLLGVLAAAALGFVLAFEVGAEGVESAGHARSGRRRRRRGGGRGGRKVEDCGGG